MDCKEHSLKDVGDPDAAHTLLGCLYTDRFTRSLLRNKPTTFTHFRALTNCGGQYPVLPAQGSRTGGSDVPLSTVAGRRVLFMVVASFLGG